MPAGDELLRQPILEVEKQVDAARTARHAAEAASALAAWVVAERSLKLLAEASTERNAEYTAAEYLAAALAADYLATREIAQRVSTLVSQAWRRQRRWNRQIVPQ